MHTKARECVAAIYLPPRTNLRAALEAAAERFTRNGRTVATKDRSWGEFFVNRGVSLKNPSQQRVDLCCRPSLTTCYRRNRSDV